MTLLHHLLMFYRELYCLTLFFHLYALFLTGTKLSEDSRKYGSDNTCTSGNTLSKAALSYGRARAQMEKERGNLLKALGTQVCPNNIVVINLKLHAWARYASLAISQ